MMAKYALVNNYAVLQYEQLKSTPSEQKVENIKIEVLMTESKVRSSLVIRHM